MRNVREWPEEEIAKLKEIYPSGSWDEIFSAFSGRTKIRLLQKRENFISLESARALIN